MVERSIETLIAQALDAIDPTSGGVAPSIQPSTTFARDSDYRHLGDHGYSRYASPNADQTASVLAALDNGAAAHLFGSGMAAMAAFFATVSRGARVVAQQVMYHGGQDWLRHLASRGDIDLVLCDTSDPMSAAGAVTPGTEVVWIETPANPTWDIVDIAATAAAAHEVGAVLVVDSTVAPPVTTRPIDFGADYVFHSATKYLNGHSDLLAGVLVARSTDERWERIWEMRKQHGATPSAFDAWLLLRGLRTLAVRYARAGETAMRFARHFEGHPEVERVLYPGLPSHPGHELAARQMTGGFGGMLSLLVTGGYEAAQRVATSTRVLIPATSLGGVESLVEHRRAVEPPHSVVPDNLLRISIGLESAHDLIADMEQALGV